MSSPTHAAVSGRFAFEHSIHLTRLLVNHRPHSPLADVSRLGSNSEELETSPLTNTPVPAMPIPLNCACGKSLNIPDQYAGQKVKCPSCAATVTVPSPGVASAKPARPLGSPLPSQGADGPEDGRYSLDEFVRRSSERDHGQGLFELESERLLEINLDGMAWTKKGSMVAYVGDVKFTREGILEHGIGKFLKKALTGEGTPLTKAEGTGKVYLADAGKKVTILELDDDSIYVNANDVLAFEDGIEHDIKMMRKITGMMAGGLFNMKLSGTGMIAITTHYDPLTLRVRPGQPVCTDPNATVAWSGSLSPGFKTDISLKTFFGRGSGESIQMLFEGDGFVVIQPYEEVYFQAQ